MISWQRKDSSGNTTRRKWENNELNTFIDAAPSDIDNHANKHCFGKNFRPIHWNNIMYSEAPFLASYKTTQNIEVCSADTAGTDKNGFVYILVFGQGLWFGE